MFAVIAVGGKQYRVIKGEYLVVDRLAVDEGGTFAPVVVRARRPSSPAGASCWPRTSRAFLAAR